MDVFCQILKYIYHSKYQHKVEPVIYQFKIVRLLIMTVMGGQLQLSCRL